MKGFITKDKIATTVSVIALVVLWKGASLLVGSELLLPPPEAVFGELVGLFTGDDFLLVLFFTILRGLGGFLISLVLGLITGVAAGLNNQVYAMVRPLLVSIRSTPVIAIILLAIIWFSNDYVPVFAGFLMMFPIICTNVTDGIRSVDHEIIEMARVYRDSKLAVVREVYLPAIAPFLIGGISNALGVGWKAVIASEVLSQPRFALGTEMHSAQTYLLVSEVVAWTIVAVSISYVFEALIRLVEKRYILWR